MIPSQDFFTPEIYKADVFREAKIPPLRAAGARRGNLTRVGLQAVGAMALSVVVTLPVNAVAGSTLRPFLQQVPRTNRPGRITRPRVQHTEVLDDARVEMRPRHVLAFRPAGRPTRAVPRALPDNDE